MAQITIVSAPITTLHNLRTFVYNNEPLKHTHFLLRCDILKSFSLNIKLDLIQTKVKNSYTLDPLAPNLNHPNSCWAIGKIRIIGNSHKYK